VLLAGFFFIAFAWSVIDALVVGVFFIGVVALPFIVWGIYRTTHLPQALTIKERDEVVKREIEFRKTIPDASVSELYSRLLRDMQRNYGPMLGCELLERRINYYLLAGKTRSEAIIKLAEERGC